MKYRDENGNFQELYFKTGDTLPIGTEVDYDGEEVPFGWEEIDNPEEYSTNEIKTNKTWIDGKPIYRKVIDLGYLPNNDIKEVDTGLDTRSIVLTSLTGVGTSSGGYHSPLNDFNSRLNILSNGKLDISTKDNYSSYYGYAIVEYTKTTDQGGNE